LARTFKNEQMKIKNVITVTNGIITEGSQGQTLIKGVIMNLAADAISVKPGGDIKQLNVSGGIIPTGENVSSYHVEGGIVHQLNVSGDIVANGNNSRAVYVAENGQTPLNNISAISKQGIAVQIDKGKITARTGLKANGTKGNIIEK